MEPCETPVDKLSTISCPCHLVGATCQFDSLQGGKKDLKFTASNAGDEVYNVYMKIQDMEFTIAEWSPSTSVEFLTLKLDCWEYRRFFCERVNLER